MDTGNSTSNLEHVKETEAYLAREGFSLADYLPMLLKLPKLTSLDSAYEVVGKCLMLREYAEYGYMNLVRPNNSTDPRFVQLLIDVMASESASDIFLKFEEIVDMDNILLQEALSEIEFC